MKSNLVGRGSRTTENCFRSSEPFRAAGSVGPMDLPSRGSKTWQAFRCALRRQAICEYSSVCVRLGKLVTSLHSVVGVNRRPRDYYLVVREPRPTKLVAHPTIGEVASHLSLLTSHLSLQGYVCS
jgi:hypothetical protein